jgi:hypothetical protein
MFAGLGFVFINESKHGVWIDKGGPVLVRAIQAAGRPSVEWSLVHKACSDRIEMDIQRSGQEVAGVKADGLPEGSPEDMAAPGILAVEAYSVSGKEGMHSLTEVSLLGLEKEMNVVSHQTQGIDLNLECMGHFFHEAQHGQVVSIFHEQRLATGGPLGDMGDVSRLVQLLPGSEDALSASQVHEVMKGHF